MTHSAKLFSQIQTLEVELHQPSVRRDPQRVAALLHEDFEEIARSGLRYDKRQTVAALEMETEHPQIVAEGFTLAKISEGAVLLTYKSFQRNAQGNAIRCTERSSTEVLKLNGLMMGLNIKKDSSLMRLEGEVRKDGQANGGAYPIMQFNIIYIMRTHVVIRGFWRPGLIMGFLLWPTISTHVAHAVERIRFSAGLKPSSFRCRLHCHCRLLLSDTMMFAQKSLNTQCLSPVHFLQ